MYNTGGPVSRVNRPIAFLTKVSSGLNYIDSVVLDSKGMNIFPLPTSQCSLFASSACREPNENTRQLYPLDMRFFLQRLLQWLIKFFKQLKPDEIKIFKA